MLSETVFSQAFSESSEQTVTIRSIRKSVFIGQRSENLSYGILSYYLAIKDPDSPLLGEKPKYSLESKRDRLKVGPLLNEERQLYAVIEPSSWKGVDPTYRKFIYDARNKTYFSLDGKKIIEIFLDDFLELCCPHADFVWNFYGDCDVGYRKICPTSVRAFVIEERHLHPNLLTEMKEIGFIGKPMVIKRDLLNEFIRRSENRHKLY